MHADVVSGRLAALEGRVTALEAAVGERALRRGQAKLPRGPLPTTRPGPAVPPPLPRGVNSPAPDERGAWPEGGPEEEASDRASSFVDEPSLVTAEPWTEAGGIDASAPDEVADFPPVPAPAEPRLTPDVALPASVLAYVPKPAPVAAVQEGAWEQTIGLKVAGWVGALVFVIGAALGVKYGYEKWVVNLPAEVRLSMLAIFGLALLGAGEWVYRRVHVWSAVGLFGAGVATLFLVSYAGHGYFDLYSRDAAFILMGLTTLIGSAVAVRGRLLSVAVLSILGGHLAPIILGGDSGRIVEFLSYILMLQVTALVLVSWGNSPRWWGLRWLSLATTGLWAMQMIGHAHDGRIGATAPLAFTLVYAGLFLAELALSAVRTRPGQGDAEQAVPFSMIVTAGVVAATLVALHDAAPLTRGGFILACAAAEALLGWALAMRVRSAADGAASSTGRVPDPASTLSIALRMQGVALVVIAVPVALAGPAVTIAWGLLALAFAAVGRRLDLNVSRLAAAVTWMLAVTYIPWAINSGDHDRALRMTRVLFSLFEQPVPVYAALAAAMSLVGIGVAWLISGRAREDNSTTQSGDLDQAGVVLPAMAGVVWVVAALAAFQPLAATLAIALYAWLIAGVDVLTPRLRLAVQALGLLALATVKWLFVDVIAGRVGAGWSAAQLGYTPLLNPLMGMGVLLGGSMLAIGFLRRRSIDQSMLRDARGRVGLFGLGGLVLGIVTLALTMEIDRVITAGAGAGWRSAWSSGHVKLLCWTMLWSTATAALGALAWCTTDDPRRRYRRLAGLALLPALLMIKHLTLDTLLFRVLPSGSSATPLANIEVLASMFVLGILVGGWWLLRRTGVGGRSNMAGMLGFGAMLLVLFTGTLEIDRGFTQVFGAGALAKQVAWSIWWGVFAVICVTGGFVSRLASMRYFGLGLFAATVGKVFLVDLHGVSGGWRTLSFIALGLLLIGTSVLYGKFSPKLLAAPRAE